MGPSVMVDLRDLMFTAELTDFDAYRRDHEASITPNCYEPAVSIYAIRDSFACWGHH